MNLPTQMVEPDLLESPVLAGETDRDAARYLSMALAFYPDYGAQARTVEELDNQFLLLTGLFNASGTQIGQPGATDRIFQQLNERYLDYGGGFLAKEQVEAAVWELFGQETELTHLTLLGPDGYLYREELGIYEYPASPPSWSLPLVLTAMTTDTEYIADLVFLRYSGQESNAFLDWQGQELPRWEVWEAVTQNLTHYDCYQVTLSLEGDRCRLSSIDRLEPGDYPDFSD